MRSLQAKTLGPFYVCAAFAILASAFVPVTALIAATGLVFDPARAFAYAMCGSLLSAALSRALGQIASGPVLRRMHGPRLGKFRERLHTHTFSATVAARILPLGNFAAVNLLSGAVAVPWLPYMLGNVLGMVFGVAALTLLAGRLATTFSSPTPANLAVSGALVVAVLAAGYALSRFIWRRESAARS
jgi:uncharacterized membrane protein YdjX (TVP38/TMEM64 family)